MTCPECPPLHIRARNFVGSFIRHVFDGFKHRSEAEVAANLVACRNCPLFLDETCTHPYCGCPMRQDRAKFWNALVWRSKKCPLGKWDSP